MIFCSSPVPNQDIVRGTRVAIGTYPLAVTIGVNAARALPKPPIRIPKREDDRQGEEVTQTHTLQAGSDVKEQVSVGNKLGHALEHLARTGKDRGSVCFALPPVPA